jgi:predicted Zn finger-like uncharacterized protein
MYIVCQKCGKRYKLKDEKVPKKNFKLKCTACQEYIHVNVKPAKPSPITETNKGNLSIKPSKQKDTQPKTNKKKVIEKDLLKCSACGEPIKNTTTICPNCATIVDKEDEIKKVETGSLVPDTSKNDEKSKGTKGCLGCFGIIALVSIFIGFCTFFNYSEPGKYITQQEYGENWAFTVDSGYIYSKRMAAIFKTGGVEYQLNGIASARGYKPINSIWKDNPEIPGTKINIGPFIQLALRNKIY